VAYGEYADLVSFLFQSFVAISGPIPLAVVISHIIVNVFWVLSYCLGDYYAYALECYSVTEFEHRQLTAIDIPVDETTYLYDSMGPYALINVGESSYKIRLPGSFVCNNSSVAPGTVPEMAVSGSPVSQVNGKTNVLRIYRRNDAGADELVGHGFRSNKDEFATNFHVYDAIMLSLEAGYTMVLVHDSKATLMGSITLFAHCKKIDIVLCKVDHNKFTALGCSVLKVGAAKENCVVKLFGINQEGLGVSSLGTANRSNASSFRINHTATTYPGWSGTPLISNGKVVGLHSGADGPKRINFGYSLAPFAHSNYFDKLETPFTEGDMHREVHKISKSEHRMRTTKRKEEESYDDPADLVIITNEYTKETQAWAVYKASFTKEVGNWADYEEEEQEYLNKFEGDKYEHESTVNPKPVIVSSKLMEPIQVSAPAITPTPPKQLSSAELSLDEMRASVIELMAANERLAKYLTSATPKGSLVKESGVASSSSESTKAPDFKKGGSSAQPPRLKPHVQHSDTSSKQKTQAKTTSHASGAASKSGGVPQKPGSQQGSTKLLVKKQ